VCVADLQQKMQPAWERTEREGKENAQEEVTHSNPLCAVLDGTASSLDRLKQERGPSTRCTSSPPVAMINKMPTYMLNNQVWYLSKTLRKCCERHFFWDINKCLGNEAVGSGSDKWYFN